MVERGDYTVNNIYQGGYSSLEPGAGDIFTGYRVPTSELGAPTKPDTANQIQQVNMLLNQGIIPIEVGALSPEVFDQIPKQHFKEINRMAKLTGADISVHAPIIEASGIGDQGWSESQRQLAEKQLIEVVDRTSPMNEKGGMSITIHGSGKIPGAEYEIVDGKKKETSLYVVNKDTGKITTVLTEEEKYYPGVEGLKKKFTIQQELESLNATEWDNTLSQLMHHKVDADTRIKERVQLVNEIQQHPERYQHLDNIDRARIHKAMAAGQFLTDASQTLSGMFNKAYKFGTDQDKARLKQASDKYRNLLKKGPQDLMVRSTAIQGLMEDLQGLQPEIYQPIEDFALDKSATTFANVAFHAFNKYKDKAPTINVENLFPGMAFSHGEELDNLITTSRQKFVERAVAKGYSRSQAESQADKIIGVTLDVGHLNMAKKKGFKDPDIIKEMEQIAKYVKHVHLTDNFGYSDSHLPPGMGNVPFKEILERLEQEGFKGKKIVEAGGFVQHFGTSPLPYSLEGLGSPIFTTKEGPYWNQTYGLQQSYSGGFGQMLPEVHYETFGAGFSQLPAELGGQRPGAKGSRISGKGLE